MASKNGTNGNGHIHTVAERIATQEFELGEVLDHLHDHDMTDSKALIEDAVKLILLNVGEDPTRDGLLRTPHRVAKMYGELLEGYQQDVETIINGAMFEVEYGEGEMVMVANIEYNSMCEHHMLPFTGTVHVAYIPRDKVVGLSKIPRIVDMFARRLQVQERLTNEIADALDAHLDPVGVMVVVAGQHSCAALRGVKKHGVNMVTTAKRGEFRTNKDLRDEFYRLAGM
ncbi:MAG: GTP cyclohydrolase I FolE [Anaerolineae bacterium]|nr:GTP cyclohydrolase I FolE [Anaerolineae bacterium]